MLQIRLLGQFDVRVDGKRIVISSRPGQSLFAYLALTAGTSHRREKLAGQFWPDTTDENARKNLRQELWRIRKAISIQSTPVDFLLADEFTVTFNRDAEYWLDVAQMEKPGKDLESLSANLAVYQGELLPGFYEDWIILERERVQRIFESKMEQLVEQLVTVERWTAVQEQSERWLVLGNMPEPAYRALMLAYNARGDMAKVSSIYQRCVDDLRNQFGVEPSAETRALYNGLLKGARSPRRLEPTQPSGTVTFLFTDIEGSTILLDSLGNQYASVLETHHEIMRSAIRKWNGKEVDTQGDSFFVTFTRALDATQCAADIQRALQSHPWADNNGPRVRMGLHTGEPLIASTGYVGMDVHRAARIGDAAHGGQILLSQATRELVMHDLPKDITIRDLGEHRLKDLKFPTPIFQLVIEGLPSHFPPVRTKFSGTEAPAPGEPPFKGLEYFDEADHELFFGRELLTEKLIDHLRESRFLSVIIGASGSGKSSLVRAGLIPALRKRQNIDWHIRIITPTTHPLEALATELTRDSESVTAAGTFMDDLMQNPRSLSLFLARQKYKQHILLVIDQFEELFTLCRDEFEREAFIDNLLTTLKQNRDAFTLVLTLRADFYAHLAQYPELREAVAKHQEYIGPMSFDELRRAIEEPTRHGHWEFEPGLVDLILRDVGNEPGVLPLLSHALLETWKRRAGHMLTLKGYADAGGVHGAIAHTAESVYQNLSPSEQATVRGIFLRLTELGEGTEDTRRRASFHELRSDPETADEVHRVLNILAEARLVTLSEETAEVAHEALIREWPVLREWLNQDREGLRLHRHITEAAYEWELLGRDPGALYRGVHLAQAREWAALHPKKLNAAERLFLNASIDQEQREEQEREEGRQRELAAAKELAETQRHSAFRLRIRNKVITTIGSIAVILALLAGLFGMQSNRNAAQAEANFNQAEAQRLALEANRLFLAGGTSEQIALLSLRSMNTHYTPEGDAALAAAARLDYPEQLFIHSTSGSVEAVAFSYDGKYILTGGSDSDDAVKMWDAIAEQEPRQFAGHTDLVASVAFSPDGKYVLTGSWDNTAKMWDATTGKEIRQFLANASVQSATFTQDGKFVLMGAWENTARLWDAKTGQELRQFITDAGVQTSVNISPDGKYFLTSNDKTAKLWDAVTGQEIRDFIGHSNAVAAAVFSHDGKYILTGSYDTTARLWDTANGKELQKYTGHSSNVISVAFSPDGKYVLTGSHDNTARLWNARTGEELRKFTCPLGVASIAISPDGMSILTASGDGIARLWNVEPETELPSFSNGAGIGAVAFSPNGRLVLTGDFDGIARLWDSASGNLLHDFVGHQEIINYGAKFSPDGKYILTGSWDYSVRLWDAQTGKEVRQFEGHTSGVNSVDFSPDGNYIVTGALDGARIWESETGTEIRRLKEVSRVFRVAFSPDGRYVVTASGGGDGTARLWDASTGQLLRRFSSGHTGFMNSAIFSPDGKYILTASDDKIARLWDVETGNEVRQFVGHTDNIWTAIFSPDGRYIATAGNDRTARLWDTETGEEIRRFSGHTLGVENVAFSPDGKYILTGSDDGTARLWDVDYHTTMDYLCSRLLRDFTEAERAQYGITDDTSTCPTKP